MFSLSLSLSACWLRRSFYAMVADSKSKSDISFAGTFASSAFAACFAEVLQKYYKNLNYIWIFNRLLILFVHVKKLSTLSFNWINNFLVCTLRSLSVFLCLVIDQIVSVRLFVCLCVFKLFRFGNYYKILKSFVKASYDLFLSISLTCERFETIWGTVSELAKSMSRFWKLDSLKQIDCTCTFPCWIWALHIAWRKHDLCATWWCFG